MNKPINLILDRPERIRSKKQRIVLHRLKQTGFIQRESNGYKVKAFHNIKQKEE